MAHRPAFGTIHVPPLSWITTNDDGTPRNGRPFYPDKPWLRYPLPLVPGLSEKEQQKFQTRFNQQVTQEVDYTERLGQPANPENIAADYKQALIYVLLDREPPPPEKLYPGPVSDSWLDQFYPLFVMAYRRNVIPDENKRIQEANLYVENFLHEHAHLLPSRKDIKQKHPTLPERALDFYYENLLRNFNPKNPKDTSIADKNLNEYLNDLWYEDNFQDIEDEQKLPEKERIQKWWDRFNQNEGGFLSALSGDRETANLFFPFLDRYKLLFILQKLGYFKLGKIPSLDEHFGRLFKKFPFNHHPEWRPFIEETFSKHYKNAYMGISDLTDFVKSDKFDVNQEKSENFEAFERWVLDIAESKTLESLRSHRNVSREKRKAEYDERNAKKSKPNETKKRLLKREKERLSEVLKTLYTEKKLDIGKVNRDAAFMGLDDDVCLERLDNGMMGICFPSALFYLLGSTATKQENIALMEDLHYLDANDQIDILTKFITKHTDYNFFYSDDDYETLTNIKDLVNRLGDLPENDENLYLVELEDPVDLGHTVVYNPKLKEFYDNNHARSYPLDQLRKKWGYTTGSITGILQKKSIPTPTRRDEKLRGYGTISGWMHTQ
jgi:hypothetical protein